MCCIDVNPSDYAKWAENEIAEYNKRLGAAKAEYHAIREEYDRKSAWYRFWNTRPGDEFCSDLWWHLKEKHRTFNVDNTEKYLPAARYAIKNSVQFQLPAGHCFFKG